MYSRIFYILIGIISIPIALFSVIGGIVYVNSDEIKNRLITELNNGTGMDIQINGKVEFAFLKHFPNMALELQGVEVNGIDTVKTPFIKADKVYLLANFWDVIQSNWNIKSTSIENGEVTMLRLKNGAINYKFNQVEPEDGEDKSSVIDIEQALLENIRFRLDDELNEVYIHIQVDDASVRGNLSAKNLSLKTFGNVYSHYIRIKEIDYAHEKEINFDGALSVVPENENYMLAIRRFMIENNEFEINGSIVVVDNAPEFDLAVRGKDIAIQDLPMLLPVEYSSKLNGIKGTGKVQISSEIKGRLDVKINPLVVIAASATDASMKIPGMDSKIENLSFKGIFTNGSEHSFATSSLTLTNLSAKTKQGVLYTDFSLTNFNKPQLKLAANGMIDISMFNRFFSDSSSIRDLRGNLEFKKVKYQGIANNLITGKLYGMEGSVSMKDVEIKMDTMKIIVPEAHIEAYEKSLSIGKLKMLMPGSEFMVTGKIIHMPGLTKSYDVPTVDLTVSADRVAVEDLLTLVNSNTSINDGKNELKNGPLGMDGFLRISSNYIGWAKFKAYDASCTIVLKGNKAEINNFSCNTMDGVLDLQSKIEKRGNRMVTSTSVKGSNINVTELFYQLDNFDQQTITSKNVAGNLGFKADIKADFMNGQLMGNTLVASSKLTINEGQLIDLKSLETLSRFIHIEELRNIKFSTLSNTVSISNGVVDIPEMLVKSNALNLSVSGQQTFEGEIDYHLKINIFDILGKKFRKKRDIDDYEEIAEDDFNFYLTMRGTIDEPIIKHEKQGVRNRIVEQKKDFHQLRKTNNEDSDGTMNTEKEKEAYTNKKSQTSSDEELEFIQWEDE